MSHPLNTTLTTPLAAAPITRLAAGQARVVNASEGTTLMVCQGRLWVTVPGCPEDLFVHAGQQLHLQHNSVLVQADGPQGEASYQLQPNAVSRKASATVWPWPANGVTQLLARRVAEVLRLVNAPKPGAWHQAPRGG